MSRENSFGRYLRDRRKHLGMTQAVLAEKMGVSKSAVAKWETDGGLPDRSNLKGLSEYLRVSLEELHNRIEGHEEGKRELNITRDVIAALESYGYRVIPKEQMDGEEGL